MKRILIAFALALTLSVFEYGWRVPMPPVTIAPRVAPALAAPPAVPTPISDNCEEVATVGIIEYYFCETNYGNFFTNSFGFMLPE